MCPLQTMTKMGLLCIYTVFPPGRNLNVGSNAWCSVQVQYKFMECIFPEGNWHQPQKSGLQGMGGDFSFNALPPVETP
ncbi:hypothetical protein XENTR_v10008576 [Xenopus tropicalis]|nr:hypothetical protein XENTR_v10008576 [Xenopus tropicalis]